MVDTSALMAIALDEPTAADCRRALDSADEVLISAGTLAEVLIVSARRNVRTSVLRLIEGLSFTVVHLTPASSRRVADAYDRWGKGVHPAALNMGDCFAYELARTRRCPLLFVGNDFARTDIDSALGPTPRRSPPPG